MAISIVSIFVGRFMILPFEEGWCDYTVATRFYLLQQDAMNCNFLGLSLGFFEMDGRKLIDSDNIMAAQKLPMRSIHPAPPCLGAPLHC